MPSKHRFRVSILTGLLITVLPLLGVPSADAQILIVEPGVEGDSWSANVGWNFWPMFDNVEFFIVNDTGAGPWNSPGVGNLRDQNPPNPPAAGWTSWLVNTDYVRLNGPSRDNMKTTFYFLGDMAQSVTIDMLAWSGGVGGTLEQGATFTWTGGDVTNVQIGTQYLTYATGVGYDRSVEYVPEGSPLIAIGVGLALLGTIRHRRRLSSLRFLG